MSTGKTCETSLRWILNYRNAKTDEERMKVAEEDGHSGTRLSLVKASSNEIDKLGWAKWFIETDGPAGYEHFLNKAWSK